jgi:hypothetical protein
MGGLGLAGAAILVLAACGGIKALEEESREATAEYVGTQAPGDVWKWVFEGKKFSGENQTLGFRYSGTSVKLPSGFRKLTIGTSTDPSVSPGDLAYAIEIPGTCLLLKPAGGNSKPPIIGSGLGANPTAESLALNWITIPRLDYQIDQEDAFGVAEFTKTSEGYTLGIQFAQLGMDVMEPGGGARLVERDGRYVDEENPDLVIGLQKSGVFICDRGPNAGGLIGVLQPSAPIDWKSLASKRFAGMITQSNATTLIRVVPGADDTLVAEPFLTDASVDGNLPSSNPEDQVVIQFVEAPAPGLFRINIKVGDRTERLAAVCAIVDGKVLLFGFGGSPATDTAPQRLYNVFLVEQR